MGDFGFAAETVQYDHLTGEKINLLLRNFAGSIHFVSPEIITHQPYDGRKSDIWSIGILLYAFLVGKFPFDAEENEKQGYDTVFEKILDEIFPLTNCFVRKVKVIKKPKFDIIKFREVHDSAAHTGDSVLISEPVARQEDEGSEVEE